MTNVGRIVSAWRYPVKSMAGERLDAAQVTLQGLLMDRWYAFSQQAGGRSMFPWLTGRELPAMLRYQPHWTTDERPKLLVRTPAGDDFAVESAELLHELDRDSGRPSFLLPNYRGNYDVAGVSLISSATVRGIAEASNTPVEPGRFRMNFYLETESNEPFTEDALVGKTLRLGDTVRVAFTERDKRCAMVTLAPHGNGDAPLTAVLTAIANLNDAHAGIYGSVLTPGVVKEGDAVVVES